MEITEFSEFGIRRRKSSEPKEIKAPMTFILMELAKAQSLAKCKIMGTESFRVISNKSPITELK
ncbi:hypothetical protein [uncultured Streptococcus sp.]|uniref:hypothetical protein n=1 Tax=uncultured Streptococcus sp. TaxID=83427 RepID=UPI002592EBCD|nr:hypothetical protein [uncultured Streptococcus sp.]